jgi:mRNA interferase RelE/StbE
MRIFFCSSFSKDLSTIENPDVLRQIDNLIDSIVLTDNLRSIDGIHKMKGSKTAYRIRIGDYRLGMYRLKEGIEFVRILHRKDIYKYFPK